MTPEQWIGLGTFRFFVGSGMVTWGTVKSMQTISHSTDVIKGATERLQRQTTKIEKINSEVAEKAVEISKLAAESLNQLTSADSFCYVQAAGAANNMIMLTLFHEGKYPISDVFVEVHDSVASKQFWDAFHQSGRTLPNIDDIPAATGVIFVQNIGTVIPNSARPLTTVANANERHQFNIRISARNGFYLETITILRQKVGGGWTTDEHLFKMSGTTSEQIWQQVSPDFPKDQ